MCRRSAAELHEQCKKGGWKTFTSPSLKNQGEVCSEAASFLRFPANPALADVLGSETGAAKVNLSGLIHECRRAAARDATRIMASVRQR